MVYTQGVNPYQRTAIETADNLKLIVMCYDAAVKDLQEAREFHQDHAMEATYEKIRHAQDIITELLVALDYERGGEIAQNLSRLYNFILRQLVGINSRQGTEAYDHPIRILVELRDAWEQVRQSGARGGSSSEQAGNRNWVASA